MMHYSLKNLKIKYQAVNVAKVAREQATYELFCAVLYLVACLFSYQWKQSKRCHKLAKELPIICVPV